jgi:putative transcriptional regulator
MPVGWRLKILMVERDISGKDLAIAAGLSQTAVSRLRRSKEMPAILKRSTLEGLCAALQCSPGDLLIYHAEKKNDKD